ncbi:thioredoxin family protein [Seonamhaeicola marinus]|uniref:Thioredoxin family protein n=1 Tax=Seonamhaeicola marinus TaxID=1912246 RepID=A0A5D0JCQ0_9FLAO|nr:thioredoxin family protein [Seonamhaeicola marinus]TYA92347.1 thioredoxin family protein [Seonamhaeicola marinus]
MKKVILTLLIAILFACNLDAQQRVKWHTDVNQALEIAFKEDKKVMLFFTGSDWCGWCKRLQKEVFHTDDFEKWSSKVVLVELDFPKRTPQDQNTRNQNLYLQSIFKVRGYPSVHFVKPEKKPDGKTNLQSLGSTGYVNGGASAWLNVANSIVNRSI